MEKILPANDGGVIVGNIVLGQLPVVFLLFLGEKIRGEGLLQQNVPHVFLIAENVFDGGQGPFPIAFGSEDIPPLQRFFDLPQAPTQQE